MKSVKGFTIIEVVLFLAITALILVSFLVFMSGTLNKERYNETVQFTLDYIQGQYSEILSIENSSTERYTCTDSGVVQSPAGAVRGQSDCSIVGRVLRTDSDAKTIYAYPLLASADITSVNVRTTLADSTKTDKEKFDALELVEFTDGVRSKRLPWDVFISGKTPDNNPKPFSMVIIRMPYSDSISMHIANTESTAINDIIGASASGNQNTVLCVHPNGLIDESVRQGIFIPARTASLGAIQYSTLGGETCSG